MGPSPVCFVCEYHSVVGVRLFEEGGLERHRLKFVQLWTGCEGEQNLVLF
jgi:hypothetical protein